MTNAAEPPLRPNNRYSGRSVPGSLQFPCLDEPGGALRGISANFLDRRSRMMLGAPALASRRDLNLVGSMSGPVTTKSPLISRVVSVAMMPWALGLHAKTRWSRNCRMGTHISDQPGVLLQRPDPDHLVHRGLASRARHAASFLRNVRHDKRPLDRVRRLLDERQRVLGWFGFSFTAVCFC
jgi:hypothetical protein